MAAKGTNCPVNETIDSERLCWTTVIEMEEISTFNDTVKDASRPAGCYWQEWESYFNNITDPSDTEIDTKVNTGGICQKKGGTIIYSLVDMCLLKQK